jgi:hypothetical protein
MDYSFQIGLDIATALSVIGASGVFMWNQKKAIDSRVRETLKVQKFRFIETLGSFSLSLAETIDVFKKLHQAGIAKGKDLDPVIAEAQKLIHYIELVMRPAFEGLSATQEKEIMEAAKKDIFAWNMEIIDILEGKRKGPFDFAPPQKVIERTVTDLLKLERAR